MRYGCQLLTLLACVALSGTGGSPVSFAAPGQDLAAPPLPAEGLEFFETHIRPVLAERCFECHSENAKVLQGGLRLDTAERLRAGGDSGSVVMPHKPDESLLLSALRYESFEMP